MLLIKHALTIFFRSTLAATICLAAGIATAQADSVVDAAVFANKRTYLFKGIGYFRLKGNTVEPGYPKLMRQWKGLPDKFLAGIESRDIRGEVRRLAAQVLNVIELTRWT